MAPHPAFPILERAIASVGSQAAMGRLCGVSQPAVSLWVRRQKALPAEHVLKVEAATGISRHDLRPDLYPRDTTPPAQHPVGHPPAGSLSPAPAGGSASPLEGVRA